MDKPTLSLPVALPLSVLFLGLLGLGALSSPRDARGRPLLLLADVKEVEEYRTFMRTTTADLHLLNGEIAALLAGQGEDLLSHSRQAQSAFEQALRLSQEIDIHPAPASLNGLRETASSAAASSLEAARLALRWVSLPEDAHRGEARAKLEQARLELSTLETSQWLATESR